MTTTAIFHDLVRRLQANVAAGLPDMADAPMKVPAASLRRPGPLPAGDRADLPARSRCSSPCRATCASRASSWPTTSPAGRSSSCAATTAGSARSSTSAATAGPASPTSTAAAARRFTCPYHSWSYDTQGDARRRAGAGVVRRGRRHRADRAADRGARRRGVRRARSGRPTLDLDTLARRASTSSLAALRLDELYPYRVPTVLDSPNWKLAADGYLDGYHIGYLHRNTIGRKAITNRNTYDLFGPARARRLRHEADGRGRRRRPRGPVATCPTTSASCTTCSRTCRSPVATATR